MAKLFTDLVNRSWLVNVAIISQSGELHTQSFNESAVVRGSPVAFFNPAIPTKIFSQSLKPDGLYWPNPIPIIQFCLSPFPKLRRAFSVGNDFLNQH